MYSSLLNELREYGESIAEVSWMDCGIIRTLQIYTQLLCKSVTRQLFGQALEFGASEYFNRARSNGQASENPCSFCAAFSSNVRVAEQPRQIPRAPINASSNAPVPFLRATTA